MGNSFLVVQIRYRAGKQHMRACRKVLLQEVTGCEGSGFAERVVSSAAVYVSTIAMPFLFEEFSINCLFYAPKPNEYILNTH